MESQEIGTYSLVISALSESTTSWKFNKFTNSSDLEEIESNLDDDYQRRLK